MDLILIEREEQVGEDKGIYETAGVDKTQVGQRMLPLAGLDLVCLRAT